MVWSSYFWLGALMTKVTGLSTAPESMAHITRKVGSEEPSLTRFRTNLRSQILSIMVLSQHLKQSLL